MALARRAPVEWAARLVARWALAVLVAGLVATKAASTVAGLDMSTTSPALKPRAATSGDAPPSMALNGDAPAPAAKGPHRPQRPQRPHRWLRDPVTWPFGAPRSSGLHVAMSAESPADDAVAKAAKARKEVQDAQSELDELASKMPMGLSWWVA